MMSVATGLADYHADRLNVPSTSSFPPTDRHPREGGDPDWKCGASLPASSLRPKVATIFILLSGLRKAIVILNDPTNVILSNPNVILNGVKNLAGGVSVAEPAL